MSTVLTGKRREAMPLDLMRGNVQEDMLTEALNGLFPGDQLQALLNPVNELDQFIYNLSRTAQGREFFEWIFDMSLRAPYQVAGATIEQTALNAARREGLNIPAEMILAAISRGEQSVAARSPGAQQ